MIKALGCTLLVFFSLIGCSHHDSGPLKPPVQVTGVLRMTGGPSGASQPGTQGRVAFVGPSERGGATTEIPTAADGSFSVQLNPGTYTVSGHSSQYDEGQGICRAQGHVVVKASNNDPVTVACDRR